MALADVLARTTITGFSSTDRAIIEGVLQAAYDGSATARTMFENWIATPGRTIAVAFESGKFRYNGANSTVEVDLGYLDGLSYISDTGEAVLHTPLGAVMHEISHALNGTTDNVTSTDYQGDNVRFVNQIWAELGLPREISYIAQARGSVHWHGHEYTDGQTIEAAVSANKNLDSSALGDSDDLLVGGAGNNTLQAGQGNDFLAGGGGNDLLQGGAGGRDTAVYRGLPVDYDVFKNDDGSWTVRHARGLHDEGTDRLENIEVVQFAGGRHYNLAAHGLTFQTDFALVIDTTGSMGPSINSVKAQAAALIDAAFAGGTVDARIGVVGYRDTTNGEPSTVHLPFTDQDSFADRRTAALTAINSITVGGGGDIPETAYDGLRTALDGSMGAWRAGAGTLRIALFTDAPAKDGALAATVTDLAHSVGATIGITMSMSASAGRVDTFNLDYGAGGSPDALNDDVDMPFDPADDPIDRTGPTQVQIFTIYTGPTGRDTAALQSIAEANGGTFLRAPNNTDLVAALMAIIGGNFGTDGPDQIQGSTGGDTLTGLDGDDLLSGFEGADTLDGGAGNDTFRGGEGNDLYILGDGADEVRGSLDDLFDDSIRGFAAGDHIRIDDIVIPHDDVRLEGTGAATRLVFYDGSSAIGSINLGAGLTGGAFMVAQSGSDTVITYEAFLPTLSEESSVSPAAINGIANQAYLNGDTASSFVVEIDTSARSSFANSLGVYEVDEIGAISGVRIISANVQTASEPITVDGIDRGHDLGFFIIQNGANILGADALNSVTLSFVRQGDDLLLANNGALVPAVTFLSHDPTANVDDQQHVLSGVASDGSGALRVAFEDLMRLGGASDDDFQDVVFKVSAIWP